MVRFDPARPDFSPYGFSCERWTPTAMPRFDRHNEIELNFLETGRLVYLMSGKRVEVPAGRLTAFWAVAPHQILEFEGLSDYFVATIPLPWFLQWRLPDHVTQAILHGTTLIDPSANGLPADRARFETWSDDAQQEVAERTHASLLEIEARLRRLAIDLSANVSSQKSLANLDDRQLSRAERMAGFIALNYAQPLTAETIGRHVDLHPNYAMALFQQTFGTTLNKFITQHRLSHAQRLLVTTKELVVNVAFNSGFGSLSRFNEAFRRAFGCTPRQYRELCQSPPGEKRASQPLPA
jgi:AraC-like DNA-binding protein